MNFGKLDRRLTLQAPVPVAQDEYGQAEPQEWQDVATVWVAVKYPTGTEAFQADQLTATQPVAFQGRYRADVLPTWRGVLDGKLYQFTAVAEIGRRAGLTINAVYKGLAPEAFPQAEAGFPYLLSFPLS